MSKRSSGAITFLTHSASTPNTIYESEDLDKEKDMIKMLRGENPRHPRAQCGEGTLAASDKIYEFLEPPTQKDEISAS